MMEYKTSTWPSSEVESLHQQLAKCKREQDELKQWLEDQVCEAKDFAYKLESKTIELTAVTKECDELVAALNEITTHSVCCDARHTAATALAKLGADKMGETG